tara:strand:+ start:802 stop:1443 length:642 start_codon:yes stop_codon:yes gene_type:complete
MAIIKGLHAKLIAKNVEGVMEKKGYTFFSKGSYNVNIIGVRSKEKKANYFDDTMLLIYKNKQDEWEVLSSVITTDPSTYYLIDHPVNSAGTAILIPGQYRGVYKVDIHAASSPSFAHEALCQRGATLKVYRDDNFDNILDHDPDSIEEGWFGVNIHRSKSSGEATYVGSYSAGCQVFKNSTDFKQFMAVINKSKSMYSNSFSYSLLDEADFED